MILILGGTGEARELAAALVDRGVDVLTALAGRVSRPALPAGRVRVGGFGGVDGLAAFLAGNRVDVVVDATHPFAARISANAAAAAETLGIPLIRLVRPSWRDHPDASRWTWVSSNVEAMAAAPAATRPLLTTGRQTLAEFLPWADRSVVARVVDPPEFEVPPAWTIIRSRGPYDLRSEGALMRDRTVDLLVTKDSGGSATSAKLDAAAALGIPVIVIARGGPPERPGQSGAPATVEQALAAIDAISRRAGAD
jgi:precorrin-6A/cobalt-precorrin-6A reductase